MNLKFQYRHKAALILGVLLVVVVLLDVCDGRIRLNSRYGRSLRGRSRISSSIGRSHSGSSGRSHYGGSGTRSGTGSKTGIRSKTGINTKAKKMTPKTGVKKVTQKIQRHTIKPKIESHTAKPHGSINQRKPSTDTYRPSKNKHAITPRNRNTPVSGRKNTPISGRQNTPVKSRNNSKYTPKINTPKRRVTDKVSPKTRINSNLGPLKVGNMKLIMPKSSSLLKTATVISALRSLTIACQNRFTYCQTAYISSQNTDSFGYCNFVTVRRSCFNVACSSSYTHIKNIFCSSTPSNYLFFTYGKNAANWPPSSSGSSKKLVQFVSRGKMGRSTLSKYCSSNFIACVDQYYDSNKAQKSVNYCTMVKTGGSCIQHSQLCKSKEYKGLKKIACSQGYRMSTGSSLLLILLFIYQLLL